MSPERLKDRYKMLAHVENGAYLETHFDHELEGRASSGSIYYYVAPEDITKFHVIDCDEYWVYNAGAPLEIWQIDEHGHVSIKKLGIEEDCEPTVYIPKGITFASRHEHGETNGTFLTCITIPRFSEEGYTQFEEEEILKHYPEMEAFYTL